MKITLSPVASRIIILSFTTFLGTENIPPSTRKDTTHKHSPIEDNPEKIFPPASHRKKSPISSEIENSKAFLTTSKTSKNQTFSPTEMFTASWSISQPYLAELSLSLMTIALPKFVKIYDTFQTFEWTNGPNQWNRTHAKGENISISLPYQKSKCFLTIVKNLPKSNYMLKRHVYDLLIDLLEIVNPQVRCGSI